MPGPWLLPFGPLAPRFDGDFGIGPVNLGGQFEEQEKGDEMNLE